jgi:hypothetical protein
LQHLKRVHPAPGLSPDHAEIPRALRAQVGQRPLISLLLGNLHARRSRPTVLAYHQLKSLLENL